MGRFQTGEGGCPVGRSNYSNLEVEHMLESICENLPISGAELDLVADCHAQFHPELERTGDQLKKKFNKLSKTKVPTGEPNIPFTIQESKAIRLLIIEKTKGATGSEEEVFATEDVDEVEDEENGDRNEGRHLQVEMAGNEGGQANDGSVSGVSRGGLVSSDFLTLILDLSFSF